jgi:hypothetical protein
MFFRNLVRVVIALLLLIACVATVFAGPILNVAGVLSIGWALLLLFITIVLLATTIVTYGSKITDFFGI